MARPKSRRGIPVHIYLNPRRLDILRAVNREQARSKLLAMIDAMAPERLQEVVKANCQQRMEVVNAATIAY